MATKRSGGSNIGLIVTLVFFVLLSVIVSVLAYMGFDGQAKLKTAKDEAENKLKNAEKRRNWYRFQAHLYRSYIGKPSTDKEAASQLKNNKQQFDSGTLDFAEGDDVAEVTALVKDKLNKEMPWDAEKSDAPSLTYEDRLKDKDGEIARQVKSADDALAAQKTAEEAQKKAEEGRTAAEKLQKDFKTSNDNDRTAFQDWVSEQNKAVAKHLKEQDDVAAVRTAKSALEGEKTKLQKTMKALQVRVDTATRDLKTARDELEDTKTRLAAIAERAGIDTRVMTAELLDASAAKVLKNWDRNWQVVAMDRKGTMPYINLGSSDGLKTQVTFSVHSLTADGKLNPTPKGTLEVVRIMGAKQAQARITSIKDAKNDPILKGDRLFNPTWDPARKKHIAIAGLADMAGDNTDATDELRKLLERQSVVVDAYIDTKDEKAPRLLSGQKKDNKEVAGEVTSNTDYLILADNLETVRHPKYTNAAYKKAFDDHVKKLKDQAVANGVPVIALKKYLDMIGYRPSKVESTGTGR